MIAVRSAQDPIIRFLHQANERNSQVGSDIDLTPLSEEESTALIGELLLEVKVTLDHARITQLALACEGFPVWIGLSIQLLRDQGSTHELPNSAKGLVDGYLHEIEQNHDESLCSVAQMKIVLRWLALFKSCNVEVTNLISFIGKRAELSVEGAVNLLNDLSSRRILKNWGVHNRYFAVKPDVIRDHILRKWLIDEFTGSPKPSEGSKELVKLLLEGDGDTPIPNSDAVLLQVARTEYMNLADGVRILAPIFEELQNLASNPSVLMQKRVIQLVEKIGFCSPEEVIDTLSLVANNVTSTETISDDIWGSFDVTHKRVVDDIPQALFDLVRFISTHEEASKLFKLLHNIYIVRYEPKGDWDHVKVPEENVIQRLVNRFGIPDALTEVIISFCEDSIEALRDDKRLDDVQLGFIKLVLGTFLNVERESTDSAGMTMYLQRHIIIPRSPLGKEIFRVRTSLKEVISTSLVPAHKTLAWDILSTTNSSINRGVGVKAKHEDMQPWQLNLRAEYEADLVWCLATLESEQANMTMSEWTAARELWDWDYKFSDHVETKKVAEQCDALYKAAPSISEFQMGELFDWSKHGDEEREICNEVADYICSKDIEALERFVDAVDSYVATKKRTSSTKSYGVAGRLGAKLVSVPFVLEFVEKILPQENSSESYYNFALEIIRAELMELRKSNFRGAMKNIQHYASLAHDKILFVSRYYSNPHPLNIGLLNAEDVSFFKDQDLKFDPNHRYEKYFDSAGVLVLWDSAYFFGLLHQWWTALGNDTDKKCHSIRVFIHSLWLTWLRYNDHTDLKVPDDLMENIIDLAVDLPSADIMFSHDLKSLCENAKLQLSIQKFNAILRSRIELSKNKEIASRPDFRSMPFEFEVNAWVAFDPETDETEMHQLIDLSLEPVYLAYADIPEYAKALDGDNLIVPRYVAQKLESLKQESGIELKDITQWSRFAGFYNNDSSTWRIIAIAACRHASLLQKKERIRLYSSFNPTSTGVRSCPVGSIDPYYEDEVKKAKALIEAEDEPLLQSYRKWMVDASINELEYAKGRAEEDFGNE